MKTATFGAGCFWKVEYTFRKVHGVHNVTSGYMGGTTVNPNDYDIYHTEHGHTEVVQVEYDPEIVSYEKLLEVFWNMHDPTQVNRQGPDFGFMYRSVIYYHDDEQKNLAEQSKKELAVSGKHDAPIATAIEPASVFYKADEHHQRYYEKHNKTSCGI